MIFTIFFEETDNYGFPNALSTNFPGIKQAVLFP